jgi:hypothetical protein
MTNPHNSKCKIKTASCSIAMADEVVPKPKDRLDLCFWHYYRMGEKKEYPCGCPGKRWPVVIGDSPGRNFARDYYNLDYDTTPSIDSSNRLYCCGNACGGGAETRYQCGQMLVCDTCKPLHLAQRLTKAPKHSHTSESDDEEKEEKDDEEEDESVWPHYNEYKRQFIIRASEGKTWKYMNMTLTGPTAVLLDDVTGSHLVHSAATALIAAGRQGQDADWWIWIAGWYDDCPAAIPKHI